MEILPPSDIPVIVVLYELKPLSEIPTESPITKALNTVWYENSRFSTSKYGARLLLNLNRQESRLSLKDGASAGALEARDL